MIPYNSMTDTGAAWLKLPDGSLVTYEQFVTNLIKEMGDHKQNLIHMALGIAGESGEIVDAIKKHSVYNKDLNRENIVEELGDIEFYIAGMRQMLGISAKEVFEYNVKKLGERYKNGYTDAAAIARADKTTTLTPSADAPFANLVGEGGAPIESVALHVIDVTAEQLKEPEQPEPAPTASSLVNTVHNPAPEWLKELVRSIRGDEAVISAWAPAGRSGIRYSVLLKDSTEPQFFYKPADAKE